MGVPFRGFDSISDHLAKKNPGNLTLVIGEKIIAAV